MTTASAQTPNTFIGRPVPDFPIEFEWQLGDWVELFDRQCAVVKDDLKRAQAEGRVIVFLSCAISTTGGGHFATNVDIASNIERNLMAQWGERFFILNPSRYQMETKEGAGLMYQHARAIQRETGRVLNVEKLVNDSPPRGGDYMRMWTKVIVEDDYYRGANKVIPNTGNLIDAFYFVGPTDVHEFFLSEARSLSQAVEIYFARKYTLDNEFKSDFDCIEESRGTCQLLDLSDPIHKGIWQQRRTDFFKYYSIKAGTNFSLGSHDEWNIVRHLNQRRLNNPDIYGISRQIALFYDGKPVPIGLYIAPASPGYEAKK